MGCLVQEIFAGHKLARTEELRELAHVPTVRKPGNRCAAPRWCLSPPRAHAQALHKHYQRLLGSVPTRRLNPAALLECAFFQNKLVRHRACAAVTLPA